MKFFLWKKAPVDEKRTNRGGEQLPISVRSEPIEGSRIWRVTYTPDGLALKSLNHSYIWQVENTAECYRSAPTLMPIAVPAPPPEPHVEAAPGRDCACGFYVMLLDQPLEEWSNLVFGKVHAWGSVALTGRVIKCSMGMKAEHAEIMSPVVLDVGCAASKECENPVAKVDLQVDYARGWCADHAPQVGALVDAKPYFREAARQLSKRYPGVEFTSFIV